MSMNDVLTREINAILDALAERDEVWKPKWIANQIIKDHEDGLKKRSRDREMWLHIGYIAVREKVRHIISRRCGPTQSDPTQYVMEGYKRLQTYYDVLRGDEIEGVPTTKCTDEELWKKHDEIRSMARACDEHADEIARYIRRRNGGSEVSAVS